MSFNIRLDTASDGENAWPHRREMAAGLVEFYAPDLIGLQEVLLHQRDQLAADLPGWEIYGAGRDDGAEAGEMVPVAWRRERLALQDKGVFWLSETPDVPSTGWDAALPRVVTWARFTDRADGSGVLFLNVHFDHQGAEARRQSALLIRRWLGENAGGDERVIVTGDFNTPPSAPPYGALTGAGDGFVLRDTKAMSETAPFGPAGTFTGFDVTRSDPEPIDYVFAGPGWRVLRHGVITQQEGGRLPSDHYPVIADLLSVTD